MLKFVGANSKHIQTLESLVQLLLWAGLGVVFMVKLWLPRPRRSVATPEVKDGARTVTSSGKRAVAIGGDATGAHISTGDTGARRSRDAVGD